MGIAFEKTLLAILITIVDMAAMNVKMALVLVFLIGYSNQLNKLLALKMSH